MAELYIVKTYT